MSTVAERVKSYLDAKNIRYGYNPRTEQRKEYISIKYNCENINTIEVVFFFDDNGSSVNVKSFSIAKVNDNAVANVYAKLNQLNADYRWVKFYLDSDQEVSVSGDAFINEDSAGQVCFDTCIKFISIIDKCYPEIMKALWA